MYLSRGTAAEPFVGIKPQVPDPRAAPGRERTDELRFDAAPSNCDVMGCEEPASGSYLHARDSRLLEFAICPGHYARLQKGGQPVVADDPSWVNTDCRPALILEDLGPEH